MSNQEDTAIKVEGVSKVFDLPHEAQNSLKTRFLHPMSRGKNIEKQQALKDISFEIKKGEFFGIVGRNGSGKSTLLKILAEIYTPTKGKVTVNGSLTPFIELGVGFNPELTGRENVYLNGAMLGFSKKDVTKMYDDIVQFAELEKFMDQKLKNYSSGMQVRLAFSVAIRAKSDILLLDEVLAVGDESFQKKCFNYFKELKAKGRTVILVSHDMGSIREYCDKAILIEKNKIALMGDTHQVASAYEELFADDSKIDPKISLLNPDLRDGTGSVRITKLKLKKLKYLDSDPHIGFDITLTAYKENADVMVAFQVKDSPGHVINESNTWHEKIKIPEIKIGKSITISWQFDNIYTDGQYTMDVHSCGKGNILLDRCEEAATFDVKKGRRASSLTDPKYKVSIAKGVK